MTRFHATPFVPGRCRGILRAGIDATTRGGVALLRQDEVGRLATRPDGVIVVDGAPFAHANLRLMSWAIPTVLVTEDQAGTLRDGEEVLLDGQSGLVASPPPDLAELVRPSCPEPGEPLHSRDGQAVQLRCTVVDAQGAALAVRNGAADIGLVRSEYLFPRNGRLPDVGFLKQAFASVCEAATPLGVTFRLLDIAGDKRPPWVGDVPGASPLGLQGCRLYAVEPVRSVYLAQLQALAELAGRCPLQVLLPYVVSLAELESLQAEMRLFLPATVPIGSMLETPAAALMVREFLAATDFAVLGCNDLMQCLFAADRHLPQLAAYLDPYAPVLYRFLGEVARVAGPELKRVQVNGLLSLLPGVLPALIGLGYRAFSVDPVMLPWLAQTVRQTDTGEAATLARAVCEAHRPEEVKRLLGVST